MATAGLAAQGGAFWSPTDPPHTPGAVASGCLLDAKPSWGCGPDTSSRFCLGSSQGLWDFVSAPLLPLTSLNIVRMAWRQACQHPHNNIEAPTQ